MVGILRAAEKTAVAAVGKTNRASEQTIHAWRQHYNAVRPHSSLNYLT
jgi:hypothetical protein